MKRGSNIIIVLFFIYLSILLVPVVSADPNPVIVQYFHQKGCHYCEMTDPIVDKIKAQYENDDVVIIDINTSTPDGLYQWIKYGFEGIPAIVINNETKLFGDGEITEEKLRTSIDGYLAKSRE